MMKTLLVALSILVLLPVHALATGGKIRSPRLGHLGEITTAQNEKVHHLFRYMKVELKFIDGSYLNEFSTQRFDGTSENVSRFIGLLKAAGLWEVEVEFRDFGEQESAFTLHEDSSLTLSVIVNSGRNDFLLKDFGGHLPGPGSHFRMRNGIHGDEGQKEPDQPTPVSECKRPF